MWENTAWLTLGASCHQDMIPVSTNFNTKPLGLIPWQLSRPGLSPVSPPSKNPQTKQTNKQIVCFDFPFHQGYCPGYNNSTTERWGLNWPQTTSHLCWLLMQVMASGRGVNDGSSRLPRECVKPCHAALTEQQKPLPCCDNIIVRTMIRQAAGTMIRNTVETMIHKTVGAPSELQPPVLAGTMICCTVGGCDSQHCRDSDLQHCRDSDSQHCRDSDSQHCRDSDSQHCRDSDSQHFVWTVIRSVVTGVVCLRHHRNVGVGRGHRTLLAGQDGCWVFF